MSGFDWVLVAVVALSVLVAAAQGFFFEVFSLAGAVLGYLLAAWGHGRLAPFFEPYVKSRSVAEAAGFIVIFFCVLLIAGVVAKVARWTMKEAGLRWMDRFLGGLFGLLRGTVVCTVLVMAATAFSPEASWLQRSELSRYFSLTARVAMAVAPPALQDKFHEGLALIRRTRMDNLAPIGSGKATAPDQDASDSKDDTHNRH